MEYGKAALHLRYAGTLSMTRRALRRRASAGLATLALVALSCAPTSETTSEPGTPVTAELLEQGKAAYGLWCASCHGTEGRGDGPDSKALDPAPRDQSDASYMDGLSDRDIAETVVFGGAARGYPNMPSMPTIFGDELVALVAFVRSLSRESVVRVELTADTEL